MSILSIFFQVEISRIAGQFPQERFADTLSESSGDSCQSRDDDDLLNSTVSIRVSEASLFYNPKFELN